MKQISRPSSKHPKDGFALVVALTMMAFVLVLLVSMTLLVNVETTSSQASLNQINAKENARLALMMALGDLQRYAGPDQRVTARAEILGSDIPAGNRMWTGTWDTRNPMEAPKWLVSGDDSTNADTVPVNPISIQHGYDPNEDGTYDEAGAFAATEAALIEVGSSGNEIAWWISDEGSKAPIAIVTGIEEPIAALSDGEPYLDYDGETKRIATAGHDPVFDFRTFFDITTATDALLTKLQRIHNRQQAELLTEPLGSIISDEIEAQLIHDATITNAFVLSNPTDGGLKKDLSYMKVLDAATSTQSDVSSLYADEDNLLTTTAIDLIKFRGNPTAFPTDEIIGMQLPFVTVQEAQDETADFTIAPAISEFQFIVGIAADGEGASLDTTTDSSLYLVYKAYMEIWNPYTVPLRIGDPTLPSELGYSDIKIVIRNLPNFTITNTTTPANSIQGSLDEISILWSDSPSAKTLRPGMVYSQTLPIDSYLSNKGAIVEALPTTPASISGTRRESYIGDFVFSDALEITIYGINSNLDEREIFTSRMTYPDFQIDYDGDNSATRFKRQLSIQAGATGITKDSIEQPGYAFGFRFKMLDEQEYPGGVQDLSDWQSQYDIRNRIIEVDLSSWDIADAWDNNSPLPYDFDSSASGYDPSDFDHTEGFKDDDFFSYSTTGGGRQDRIARFIDLPTSEVTDVGIFRSLKFNDYSANSIGNNWGNKLNSLYDRYFFSTLPNPSIATWNGTDPLANSRIVAFETTTELTSPETASSLLLSNGFNINSTSKLAWQKLLAGKSYKANDFEIRHEKNETDYTKAPIWETTNGPIQNAFFNNPQSAIYNLKEREASPRYNFTSRDNTPDYEDAFRIDNTTWLTDRQYPTFWQSVREITDTEVSDLATAISQGIQLFGTVNGRPFLSLEEFLNEGVLQAAINAVPSINKRLSGSDTVPAYTPSHISEMTLMNAIGPLSFVRSDTFRIKTISRTKDSITGQILATTACEALVQRTPTPHNNSAFGREFQIIDLKWTTTTP